MQFIGTGDRILTENFNVGYLYTITFKSGNYINTACIGIGDNFVMFQRTEPDLLFTLNVDTAEDVDTIVLYDSGGGTNNYDDLSNRPQINSHTLTGNMSGADLGLQNTISDLDTIRAGAASGATAVQPAALSDYQPVISDLDTIRAGAASGATAVQPADMTSALAAKQDVLSTAQLAAVNSGITSTDVAQIETNKNNISSIGAIIGKQVYSAFLGQDSGTAEYQMKTADFQTDTPNTQQCGIYIVYAISWSTTPVVSIYTVGYSGGTAGYNVVTKIVGTDSLISVDENRKITYTGKGKISIYAMR